MTDTIVDAEMELKAMTAVVDALKPVASDGLVVARVLRWAMERHGVEAAPAPKTPPEEIENGLSEAANRPTTYESFDELFDAANPDSATEKALVAGYWFQVVKEQETFEGFQLNKELKNHGHPSANITRDLGQLIGRQPRLVMQVQKHGTTRQARKKYKLTREGIKSVDQMLRGGQA